MPGAVRFESSHVRGDYTGGRLTVVVARPDETRGQTAYDTLWFSVPSDFHTHNDSVAAALLTLVGRRHSSVRFNFPISRHCADTLTGYYHLDEVGPVDESQEPRQPGRFVSLNLSGGCDSSALWCLLTQGLGLDFKTITSEYGGRFAHEVAGFGQFQRHVSCATNLRHLGFDEAGRFNAAVPLLYADYLDLRGLASGHTLRHTAEDLGEFRAGVQPGFVAREAVYRAGGLEELHLCRGVHTLGMLSILLQARPEATEGAVRASGSLRVGKAIEKTYLLKWLCAERKLPEPAWLAALRLPPRVTPPAKAPRPTVRSLFIAKHMGLDVADRILPGVASYDLAFLNDMSLAFLVRHHPGYVPYMPADLRDALLAGYLRYGIEPFISGDWEALELLDDFVSSASRSAVA